MPRDSNGNYTLPSGNPVVTGEVISTGWANPTMSDLGAEITNSLDRQGRGGMLAPFKFVDGTNSQPGMTWTNEPTTGFYRAGASDMRATVAGVARMRWTGTGVDVYDTVAGTWVALASASGTNFALLNVNNKFTVGQTIVNSGAALGLWKDATPTVAGRIAFNVGVTDGIDISHFGSTSGWVSKFLANATDTSIVNVNSVKFNLGAGAVTIGQFNTNGFGIGVIPTSKLHVVGASNAIQYDTGANSDGRFEFLFNGTRAGFINVPGTGSLDFYGDTSVRLVVGSSTNAIVSVGSTGATVLGERSLFLNNSANTLNTSLRYLADSGGAAQLRVAERGAAWHWYDAVNAAGDIQVGTVDPSLTGRVGSLFLVYE